MAVEYLDIFANSKLGKENPIEVFSMYFLTAARILPIVTLSPFFGAKILPHPVKMVLTLALCTIVMPTVLMQNQTSIPFNITLLVLLFKEMLIGLILGFFLGLPFLIVTSAGIYTDHQRGAASLMTNDPTIQNQSSPIGTLYNMVLIVLFFGADGPFYVIDAVLDSYTIVPPDKFLNPLFFSPTSLLKVKLVHALNIFVSLTIQLSAPALLAILMTDVFLGIINRLAPQVQITFLGMGLKSWLALFLVLVGWYIFVEQLNKQITVWLREFLDIIPMFNFGADTTNTLPHLNESG